ncbi:putative extracellular protein, partial [Tricharina praecox]|uniref:putative extracellular protein n=1 Tax=Tricharina praecox TaxID=43433 RepID=UPI00221EC276
MFARAVTHQCVSIPRLLAVLAVVLALHATLVSAHMAMADPPALRYKSNPYKVAEDYDYLSPLSPSGSNYPCKGYHEDLGTPGGKSARWFGDISFGGSCQLSFSFDGGNSWQVIKSFVGGCVKPDQGSDQSTWLTTQGNREIYMNCAVVTISGGKRKLMAREEFNVLPSMLKKRALGPQVFLANLGNGCTTQAGADVEFPDPGNNVERGGAGDTAAPVGDCGKVV